MQFFFKIEIHSMQCWAANARHYKDLQEKEVQSGNGLSNLSESKYKFK